MKRKVSKINKHEGHALLRNGNIVPQLIVQRPFDSHLVVLQVVIGVQWLVSSPAQVAFIDDVGLTISSAAGLNSSLTTSNASLEVLDSRSGH